MFIKWARAQQPVVWRAVVIILAGGLSCTEQGVEVVSGLTIESVFAVNDDAMVTLGWTGFEDGIPDEVDIHRSSAPDFTPSSGSYYATLPGTFNTFQDPEVVNGSLYYYRLVPVEIGDDGGRTSGTASSVAIGRPFDYDTIQTIRYSTDIQTIFNSSCAVSACHVGSGEVSSGAFGKRSKTAHNAQYSLKSWEDLFFGPKESAVVVPFKSSKSDLVRHTNSDTLTGPVALPHMPLPGFDLPPAQISVLQRWIDGGGQNDMGEVPFAVTPIGRIFSVCSAEDLIAVIDVQTNFLMRYVNVGRAADPNALFGAPHHVKVDRQGEYFYVTLINSQQLWKFSASTYELEGTLNIPFQPADIAISASGDTAYVTSFSSTQGLVTIVDTRAMQTLQSITVPFASNPHGIVLSNDGSKAFVTNAGSGNLTMIHLSDNSTSLIALDTLGNPFSSDVSPYLVAITPDDRYLFVTDYAQDGTNVYVVDLVLDPTKPSRVIPIGGRSIHVAITPDGSTAFVCNLGTNSVQVISIGDFSVRTIANVGKQPHGVVFTPDGTSAYVTTENTFDPDPPHHPSSDYAGVSFVFVIDVASLAIVEQIEVAAFGQGIAFSP